MSNLTLMLVLLVALSACQSAGPVKSGPSYSVSQLSADQKTQYQQALALMNEQQYQKAEPTLLSLSQNKYKVREIWINLIVCQIKTAQWDKAQANTQLLLTQFEPSATGLNLAGLVAVEQGQFKQAETHYQQALKLNAQHSHSLYNLALLYDVYLDNSSEAVAYYQRYLALNPDDQTTRDWTEQLAAKLK